METSVSETCGGFVRVATELLVKEFQFSVVEITLMEEIETGRQSNNISGDIVIWILVLFIQILVLVIKIPDYIILVMGNLFFVIWNIKS